MSKKEITFPLENGNVIPGFINGKLKSEQNYFHY